MKYYFLKLREIFVQPQTLIISELLSVLLLPSCSSMDTEAVKKMDQVAVGIVGVDKYIDMGDYSGIGTMIQRLSQDESFDLKPIAQQLHDKTFNEYEEIMPFSLMQENKVLNTSAYKNFQAFDKKKHDDRFKKNSHMIKPEGYMEYNPSKFNKKQTRKLVKAMPAEADGMMLIYLTYTMKKNNVPVVPFSNASIIAKINLELYDKAGERVMKINKQAESEKQMKVVAGAMLKVEEIQPMCQEATEMVFEVVDEFIKKELSS